MVKFAETLLDASYKGVSFSVTESSIEVGRRTVTFEYPQRDFPYVEDLGKKARKIKLTAVYSGQDYVTDMGRLISVMEEEGPAVLVHPTLGPMMVTPTGVTKVVYDATKIGFASADLEFTESGAYSFPKPITDTASVVERAYQQMREISLKTFEEDFNITNSLDFIRDAVAENIAQYYTTDDYLELGRLYGISDQLQEYAEESVQAISQASSVLGSAISAAFAFADVTTAVTDWRRITRILSRLIKSDYMNRDYATGLASATDAAKLTQLSLSAQSLARQSLIAEMVNATAYVGGSEDIAEGGISYDEMIQIRDLALDAIDAEMLKIDNDDVYLALESARTAVADDLTTRAQDAARLIFVTPQEVTPALVIAYNFYGDASRSQEIIDRNKIRHGGFVPAKELKLLSR